MERDQSAVKVSVLNLPAELLVIVVSYLSLREKVKLRYVSRSLRVVTEIPSLWREFVWDYYDTREELCVKNVLKRCGEHIKRLVFPGYLTPKLDEMLQYCNNVRHVSLPVVTRLSPDQLAQLGEAVQHMKYLHTLDIGWDGDRHTFKPLLLVGSKLQELTLYVREHSGFTYDRILPWMSVGFRPSKLNIFFTIRPVVVVQGLLQKWQQWNSKVPANHTAWLKIYSRFRTPLNLSPVMPAFQLQFGQTAVIPVVKVKQFDRQGLDYLLLTDRCSDGKAVYKATTISSLPLNHTVSSAGIDFITHFSFIRHDSLLPCHLEQLGISCRNLQHLILRGSRQCLRNVQGLRVIASHCHNLQGLDISGISVLELEDQIQLWEILSGMELTHLAVDFCTISSKSGDTVLQKRLTLLFEKCSKLLALEYWCRVGVCQSCTTAPVEGCTLISHFPSLLYCKTLKHHSTSIQDIITSCKTLKYCRIHTAAAAAAAAMNCPPITLSLAHSFTLQQLYIDSQHSVVPDAFMSSVSAHGGLVHVFLSVASVSFVGISVLIENSPELVTFQSILEFSDENNIRNVEFSQLEMILQRKFHDRKLFYAGGFKMLQRCIHGHKLLLNVSFLEQTEVYFLWDNAVLK